MGDAAVGSESIRLAISFMSISFFLISIFNFLCLLVEGIMWYEQTRGKI